MKAIWLGVLLLCSLSSWASDEVGNGAGIAENYLIFSYLNLEKYLDYCLASEGCHLNEEESLLLRKIRSSLHLERQTEDQISFKSESKGPGFFVINGVVRVAKTGDDVGDLIYINVDLLYAKEFVSSALKSITFPTSVSILIHEFGHHHGEKDHAQLDVLGSKVSRLLQGQTQEISVGPQANYVRAMAINLGQGFGNFTQLLVSDKKKTIDLSKSVKGSLHCPNFPDAEIGYLLVWNLHWMREYWHPTATTAYNRHPLRGRLPFGFKTRCFLLPFQRKPFREA